MLNPESKNPVDLKLFPVLRVKIIIVYELYNSLRLQLARVRTKQTKTLEYCDHLQKPSLNKDHNFEQANIYGPLWTIYAPSRR